MNRGKITINDSGVLVELNPDGQVWLSKWELGRLFGVYESTITANIKAVIKSGAVRLDYSGTIIQTGSTCLPELFNLEVVIALAFRINSANAAKFRDWVVRRTVADKTHSKPQIFLQYIENSVVN